MVAAGVFGVARVADFDHRRAAEFPAPDDERVVEQSALLQVVDQRRGRLIGNVAVLLELAIQIRVLVPTGVHQHARSGRRAPPCGAPAGSWWRTGASAPC